MLYPTRNGTFKVSTGRSASQIQHFAMETLKSSYESVTKQVNLAAARRMAHPRGDAEPHGNGHVRPDTPGVRQAAGGGV